MNPDFNPASIVKACGYSMAGLAAALRHERAFRQEAALAVLLVPLALWLGATGVARAMLVASVVLVLIVELVNTAVETLVERISPEWHKLSGRAKDIGSASVFLAIVNMVIVWICVLWT